MRSECTISKINQNPYEIGSYDEYEGVLRDIDVSEDYAYMTSYKSNGRGRFRTLDISALSDIDIVGTFHNPRNMFQVKISGDFAYLLTSDEKLKVLDISNPSNPREVAVLEEFDNVYDLEVSGNYAFIADYYEGLKIIDISTPENPIHVSTWYTPSRAYSVSISGNFAYVGAQWRGLRIIDISDPMNPWEVGSYETEDFGADEVEAFGNYAYVGDWDYNMRIIDVSDPQNPVEISTFVTNSYDIFDIEVSGNIVFLGGYVPGFRVIDVSDPFNPVKIDERSTFIVQSIVIKENYIYELDRGSGLFVYEFRLPAPEKTISGKIIRDDGSPLEGVLMDGFPGDPTTTNEVGEYTAAVPHCWSGTVTPTLAGYYFTPPSRIYNTVTSNQLNQHYTGKLGELLRVTTTSLPEGILNNGYNETLWAIGGTTPYIWSFFSGSLPDGLNINTTGLISGAPTEYGNFTFTVQVTDSASPRQSATQQLSLDIRNTVTLTTDVIPGEGGSVSINPDLSEYIVGDSVELTVTANAGYSFIGWSGDATGRATLVHVQMTRDKSVMANFALIADLPDYYISSFIAPDSADAGETIGGLVSVAVVNQGASDTYSGDISVGVYLSDDAEITTSDILLWKGRSSILALDSEQTTNVTIDPAMRIPTTISPETYYIGVLVDETEVIAEQYENNNYASRTITISSAVTGHLELVGGWPYGALYGLDIDETRNLALIGHGAVLQILNVSIPSNPTLISELPLPPSDLFRIKIRGRYAYVANGVNLKVIDIFDPENPEEVGSFDTSQWIYGLDISGDYAYVTNYHEGLRIIDISDPANPFQTAFLPLPHITRVMKVSGNYAYVQTRPRHREGGEGIAGLRIIDISNASAPVEIENSFIEIENGIGKLDVDASGQFLFAPIYRDRLRIFDISDPEVLSEVASYYGVLNPNSVTISGNFAYVLDQDQDKLVVLDISDVYNLEEVSTYSFEYQPDLWETRVAGNLCFVTCYGSLKILDFSDLGSPQGVGSYDVQGRFYYGDVSNDHAYLVNYKGEQYGLKVLDISNLSDIIETPTYDVPYDIYGLAVSGNHAYLAAYEKGLRAIDVTNPSSLQEVGFCEDARQAYDVAISGNYAYVADGWSGLRVIDISTPSSPTLVSTWDTPGWAEQLALSGNYAYIADNWYGLRIIDISDPLNPWEVGSYEFEGDAWNVAVSGSYAYVSDGYKVIRIVDVSDPENPSEVSSLDVYLSWTDIGISGNFIFVPDYIFGVRVIDISDPANPTEVEVLRELFSPEQIIIRENNIYVVSDDTGLYVYEFRLLP
jgi:hypothetical protein